MKIRILMMQKDEVLLLRPWIAYHGALVGRHNLTIFDNGSTAPDVLDALNEAEEAGIEVIREHNTVEHFREKGALIGNRIKAFDRHKPADFYFPLDCDEFLVSQTTEGTVRFDRDGLQEALRPHLATQEVLRIRFGYDNDPRKAGHFFSKGRGKCFFAQGACVYLDLGFHHGLTAKGKDYVFVKVGYLHMHNKPLGFLKEDARNKMIGRVADFRRETLLSHQEARGQGAHLIAELLIESEDEYFSYLTNKYIRSQQIAMPALAETLDGLGFAVPY